MLVKTDRFAKVLTFIVSVEGKGLSPLTRCRPQPLIPFGRELRIIDFTLSNCRKTGLNRVFVLPDCQAGVVAHYLDSLDWQGSVITVSPDPSRKYNGTADALFQNLGVLQLETPDYVLVLLTGHIYDVDFSKMLRSHVERGAQVTIATNGMTDIGAYFIDASIFRRVLLMDALTSGNHNFDRSLIYRAAAPHRIAMFDVVGTDGKYWGPVDTIDNYYKSQMNFSRPSGSEVGVVATLVQIASSARIRDSILLRQVSIGEGACIRKTIIEEDVRIPDGALIGFDVAEDRDRYLVTQGGVVVVDRNGVEQHRGAKTTPRWTLARTA
jgi:glucose-1-phosphate adenylyltransferase